VRSTQGRRVSCAAALALSAIVLAVSAVPAQAVPGSLTFVELQRDGVGGVDGLDTAIHTATSPDGRHVYATGSDDMAVAVFARNSGTGALSFIEQERNGIGGVQGLNGADGVVVSPDGKNVYVAGFDDNAVVTFTRNPSSGALSFLGAHTDGVDGVEGLLAAEGVALSPDGRYLYVTSYDSDSIVTFARDPATGVLTFMGRVQDGVGGVEGLDGATYSVVTADGRNLYAVGNLDNSLVAFARDPVTGALSFIGQLTDGVGGVDGLDSAFGIAASPDAKNVYVTAFNDNSVATFSRDPATGGLTFLGHHVNGVGGVEGIVGPLDVAVSPDGANVYASGRDSNSVASFSRNPVSGALTFLEADIDGTAGVDGLEGVAGVDVTCDGRNLHTTSLDDDAVAVFSREGGAPGTCAPDLEFTATKQKIDKFVEATATCGLDPCTIEATGKLKGVKKKPSLKTAVAEAGFDEDEALSIGIGKRARKKAKAARKEGEKVFARLNATAADPAGNAASPEKIKIKLK
jgi:6-phosphogluconolactonase (cycloisomerase 2 family)